MTAKDAAGNPAATVLGVPAGAMAADKAGWPASFAGLALLGLLSAGLVAVWFPRMEIARPPSMLSFTFMLLYLLACYLAEVWLDEAVRDTTRGPFAGGVQKRL